MKLLTVLATLFLSATALACPNLVGTYTCQQGSDAYNMTIDQQVDSAGVTVYLVDGQPLAADNQWRNLQDPNQPDAEGKLSCAGQELNFDMKGSLYDENKNTVGDMTINSNLQKNGSNIDIKITGVANAYGQQHPINEAYSCILN